MSQTFHLFQLQKIDTQIDQIDQRLKEIDSLLLENELLRQAKALLEGRQDTKKKLSTEQKSIEHTIEAKRIKLEQSETSLYSGNVKLPKDLQSLHAEVNSLKKIIAGLEDNLLEKMLELEQAENDLKTAENEFNKVQGEVFSHQALLRGEQSQLNGLKDKLAIERSAAAQQVNPDSLTNYNHLRKIKRGIAVSKIIDNACTACGSVLTPAECQAARSPQVVSYCSTCGRIIYSG